MSTSRLKEKMGAARWACSCDRDPSLKATPHNGHQGHQLQRPRTCGTCAVEAIRETAWSSGRLRARAFHFPRTAPGEREAASAARCASPPRTTPGRLSSVNVLGAGRRRGGDGRTADGGGDKVDGDTRRWRRQGREEAAGVPPGALGCAGRGRVEGRGRAQQWRQ